MKKIMICIVSIILLSGLGVVTISSEETSYEKTTLYFSNLQIKEQEAGITLELNGTNSILLLKDHYIVPTRLKTFTFPFGTEIISVKCSPKNIFGQYLAKELNISLRQDI